MTMANIALVLTLLVLLVVIPTTTATTTVYAQQQLPTAARITELEQQDPAFAYYRNTTADCGSDSVFSNLTATERASVPSAFECSMTHQTAFDDWCGAGPTFHAEKCDLVKAAMEVYQVIQEADRFLSGMEYADGTPYYGPNGTINEPPTLLPPRPPAAAGGNEVSEQQQQERLPQTYTIVIDPSDSASPDTEVRFNPARIQTGDTVRWENQDGSPHTVTSGINGQPDGKFDSGQIEDLAERFEHTFTEAGDYPYFCLLHPNKVGTVSVS